MLYKGTMEMCICLCACVCGVYVLLWVCVRFEDVQAIALWRPRLLCWINDLHRALNEVVDDDDGFRDSVSTGNKERCPSKIFALVRRVCLCVVVVVAIFGCLLAQYVCVWCIGEWLIQWLLAAWLDIANLVGSMFRRRLNAAQMLCKCRLN